MKFIYTTDTHGQSNNPASRKDDFSEAVLRKLEYIGEYAEKIKAAAVIHGGDWIHSPDVSESFIRKMAQIVKAYPCEVVGVLGNHDIYGYNPDTFIRTSLSIAEGLGMFKRLYKDIPFIIEDENVRVNITGQDSCFDLDTNERHDYYEDAAYDENSDVNIHVVHGMLLKSKWPQLTNYTVVSGTNDNSEYALNDCKSEIILTGHEHMGYGVIKDENTNTTYCNPGSLLRVTSSTGDVGKDVSIAVITVNGKNDFSIELVKLPSHVALPASEVLDYEQIQKEKKEKEQVTKFMNKINSKELSGFDIYTSLKNMCDDDDISDEVKEICRAELQKAEEQLRKEC